MPLTPVIVCGRTDLPDPRPVNGDDMKLYYSPGACSLADHIVLLSAPWERLLERVTSRSNNPYGRTQPQQDEIRFYLNTVEPLLRRSATLELDGASPINELADAVEALTA